MIFAIKTIICIAVIGPITAWAYHIEHRSSGLCQKKTACSAI